MLLTQEEREKFAAWLRQEAQTAKALVEQMNKLPFPIPGFDKAELSKAKAFEIVIHELERPREVQVIG